MAYSPQDVYARHLISCRGYPLWTPEPNMNLPEVYVRQGLKIGDVGVVVPEDGSFDVFFNISLPPDHSLHRETGVPDNFMPVLLGGRDIAIYPEAEGAGRIISTTSMARAKDSDAPDDNLERPVQPGPLSYEFTLSSQEGAVLILPEGAERYYLRNKRLFMDKAIRHAVDWYNFAEQRLGRIISHDSLYLITGFYKARSWSLAAYQQGTGAGEASAQFKAVQVGRGNIAASYTWQTTHAMDWRVGPSDLYYNGMANQTVFIQGFKIALREGILGRKRVNVKADVPSVQTPRIDYSSGSRFSNLWSGGSRSSSGSMSGSQAPKGTGSSFNMGTVKSNLSVGESEDNDMPEDVTIQHFPEVEKPFHPSDVINQHLLQEVPSAAIAITHDNQWASLLERGLLDHVELSQKDHLIAAVMRNYSMALACEDVVYLQNTAIENENDDETMTNSAFSELSTRSIPHDIPIPPLPDSDFLATNDPAKPYVCGYDNNQSINTVSSHAMYHTAAIVQKPPASRYRQAVPTSMRDASHAADKRLSPQELTSYPSPGSIVGAGRVADPTLTQLFAQLNLGTQPRSNQTINVILFSEPGVRRSEVINLIACNNTVRVLSAKHGSTLQSTRYDILVDDDTDMCIFETVGLKEPEISGSDYLVALENAYKFVQKLSAVGGVHLLLFCIRAYGLTATMQSNYRLFSEVLFQKKVPLAHVVTGLEGEGEMEDWWARNKTLVERYGLKTDGHACITYVESQKKLRELLKSRCLKTSPSLPKPLDWFLRLGTGMHQFIDKHRKPTREEITNTLIIRLKLDLQTVQGFLDTMERGDAQPSRRSREGRSRDVPLARVSTKHRKGEVNSSKSSTMSNSRFSDGERWRDEPQRADLVEIARPWNTSDPGKRDNEPPRQKMTGESPTTQSRSRYSNAVAEEDKGIRWDNGVWGRETTAVKVKFEPLKANLQMEAYVKSDTGLSKEDIRLNFAHDLTGHVTISNKYPFVSGSYGKIYRGRFIMNGKSIDVAIKVYKVCLQRDQHIDDRTKRFRKEITALMKLRHENVLQLFGTIRDANIHPDIPAMVCPWIENGALTGYLERNKDLPVTKRLILIDDVARGLQYLHSLRVIHGDLSGSNVLVNADGRACIADFGLNMLLTTVGGLQIKGEARWMAPELLDPPNSRTLDPATRSDVYSFGSIMLQTLTGNVPYHLISRDEHVIFAIVKGKRPANQPSQKAVTNGRWKFIERCWSVGGSRPSSDEIVEFTMRELTEAGSNGGWIYEVV